jgi:Inner membrane protein YgaP-like, transmembrane domain
MTTNEGIIDRIVRVVAGLALIGLAFGIYGPEYTTAWGWIGLVPLVTGLVGWCPAYSLVGIKTCSR